MSGYADPKDMGNSRFYETGKPCIEPGCDEPAGTAWGPHWCFEHNVERMNRINNSLDGLVEEKRNDD